MLIFLLANWRWLIPSAVAIGLGVLLGLNKIELAAADVKYAKLERKIAETNLAAFTEGQKRQQDADQVAIDIAGQQSVVQEKIVKQIVTLTKEIPVYVKDDSSCITIGLVRVLDAAAQGVDPATLTLGPGESDDACAPIKSSALAGSVADNYSIARQNAAQLGGLQQYVSKIKEALERK